MINMIYYLLIQWDGDQVKLKKNFKIKIFIYIFRYGSCFNERIN